MNAAIFQHFHSLRRLPLVHELRSSGTTSLTSCICGLLTALVLVICPVASAQSTYFDGPVIAVAGQFNGPAAVVVDTNGNLFVADCGDSAVKEVLAVNGSIPPTPTINTLGSGFNCPQGIAVDANGNIFVADTFNSAVKEIVAAGGYNTVTTLGSGFNGPYGVAVDASGNVFVADTYNLVVKEILAVNGVIPASPTVSTIATGFIGPVAVAVDGNDNVFVADPGIDIPNQSGAGIYELLAAGGYSKIKSLPFPATPEGVAVDSQNNVYITGGSASVVDGSVSYSYAGSVYEIMAAGGTYTNSVLLGLGFLEPLGVATDANGNIYVADYGNNAIKEILSSGTDFGPTPVGNTTPLPKPFTFTFTAATKLASTRVLTQGATGLDFIDAGTGSCSPNTQYAVGAICSVNVKFAPTHAGTRPGAVELLDSAGSILARGYTQGIGISPQIAFAPASQSTLGSGFQNPVGVAVDAEGNVFVADEGYPTSSNGAVDEIPASSGYSTVRTLGTLPNEQINPNGVAIDGTGNIIVTNVIPPINYYVIASNADYTTASEFGVEESDVPSGVAVDGNGSVFLSFDESQEIVEWPSNFTLYHYSIFLGGIEFTGGFNNPSGVAVDGSGNIFVADTGNNAVKEILSKTGQTVEIGNGFKAPNGVAVDLNGNVFVADTGNSAVKEILAEGGYTIVNTLGSGFKNPQGVAVDAIGNVYVADTGNQRVVKLDYADAPSIAFASTSVGLTSADSPQTFTVQNIGNGDLIFPVPHSGGDPSIAANFSIDGSTTCPVLSGSSSEGTLTAGASCSYSIDFTPATAGSMSGSLILTDDSLNLISPYATQSVTLSGTGTAAQAPSVTLSPTSLTFASQSVNTTSAAQTVTLTNSGTSTLSITSVAASGDFAETNTCGTSVAAGADCAISVTFLPTAVGTRSGMLTITDNASGSPQTAALSGIGLSTASPSATTTTLMVTASGQTVPSVASGTAVMLTATVTAGGAPVTPGSVSFCDATEPACRNAAVLGTAQLSSAGTATFTFFPGDGEHSYEAVFEGTQTNAQSTSAAQSLAVTASYATQTQITSAGMQGDYALTGTVTGSGSTVTPTGAISFVDTTNQTTLGTANLGTGALTLTLTNSSSPSTSLGETYIAKGDFNGDGKMDLAVAIGDIPNALGSPVGLTILLGNGDGTFTPAPQVSLGKFLALSVTVGDFNSDGKLDLAITGGPVTDNSSGASFQNELTILLGNGDGTFTQGANYPAATANYSSLTTGDFNQDGNVDLAVLDSYGDTISIFLGKGDGNFASEGGFSVSGQHLQYVTTADLRGNGKVDLVLAGGVSSSAFQGRLSVYEGNGDGTFTAGTTLNLSGQFYGAEVNIIAVGDFNGDGKTDLAAESNGPNGQSMLIDVFLGNGDETFKSIPAFTALSASGGTNSLSIGAADFNQDSKSDLVAYDDAGVGIFLSNGDGTFTASASGPGSTTDPDYDALVTGDFNGDGVPDIALADSDLTTAVIWITNATTTASATVSSISAQGTGSHNVEASYAGDANFSPSTSSVIPLSASPIATTLQLNASPASVTAGTPVVLTATLAPYSNGNLSTNSEIVTFFAGSTSLGTAPLSSGVASLSVTSLPVGTDSLTAVYPGDANFAPSTSSVVSVVINPTTPTATLSGTSLTFPSQTTGTTSAAQTVTVSNSGNAGLSITSIATSGDFAETNTCGTSVAAGANCTVSVTFTPTATGTRAGTLTVTDNASGSPQTVALSGTGTAPVAPTPAVTLSPTSLNFGAQTTGSTSAAETVTLSNSGTAPLSITSIAASGDFAQINTCGTSVAAGANCVISITFMPTATGTRTGTLTIADNATGSPQTAALSGTGSDIAVTSSSSSLTVSAAGGSATATIQLASAGGFSGTVNLACKVAYQGTGTPTDAPTCSLNPTQEQVTAGSPAAATLTVSTTAASASNRSTKTWRQEGAIVFATLLLCGMVPRRRWRGTALVLLFLAVGIGAPLGCGGGSAGGGGSAPPPSNPGTTTGSYSVTVTASSGTASATLTIPLSVQ